MPTQNTIDRVLSLIDAEQLADLASDLVNIPSPTGYEEGMTQYVSDWFKSNGFKTVVQEVEEGRGNAVGILKGDGDGPSLMFNSHMDTALTGTEDDLLIVGDQSAISRPEAKRVGDQLAGLGVVNDKGPLAAFMIAGRAIKDSGIRLKGDVILAGVVGEIGKGQIGKYHGKGYRGKGVGTRFLLTNGIMSDYALVAEPSNFTVTWALPGVVYIRISTRGRAAYIPFTERTSSIIDSQNAIVKMVKVIEVIENWAWKYQEGNKYTFAGGEIVPKVNIGSIDGGLPYKPNFSPAICSIYVDVRIPPNRTPLDVAREVESVLRKAGLDVEVETFMSQMGYESYGNEESINAVKDSHRQVFKAPPDTISVGYTSMWNDNNIYSQMGIPNAKYGPAPKEGFYSPKSLGESIGIQELVDAAKVYAITALKICGIAK